MAQASGSAAQILIVEELVFGVTPTNPQMKLVTQAAYGESLNASSEEVQSNSISPNRGTQAVRKGLSNGDGSIPLELSADGMGLILKGFSGVTTGTGTALDPFIHKRGKTIPSFSIEKGFTDSGVYFMLKGMKTDTLQLNVEPGQITSGSITFKGKGDPSVSNASKDTTPDVVTHIPYNGIDAIVKVDGAQAIVSSFSFNLSNGLNAQNVIGSAFAHSVNVGRGEATGTISILFQNADLFEDWLADTQSSIELLLTNGAKSLSVLFPKVHYNGSGLPNIESADGVLHTMNFRAVYDSVENSDFVIKEIVS